MESRYRICAKCKKRTYQSGLGKNDEELCLDCWYKIWKNG